MKMKLAEIAERYVFSEKTSKPIRLLGEMAIYEFQQTGQFDDLQDPERFMFNLFDFTELDIIQALEDKQGTVEVVTGQEIYKRYAEGFGMYTCMSGKCAMYTRIYTLSPIHQMICASAGRAKARRMAVRLDDGRWYLDTVYSNSVVLRKAMKGQDPFGLITPVLEIFKPYCQTLKTPVQPMSATFLLQYPIKRLHKMRSGGLGIPIPFQDTFGTWLIVPIEVTAKTADFVIQMHSDMLAADKVRAKLEKQKVQVDIIGARMTAKKYAVNTDIKPLNGLDVLAICKHLAKEVINDISS